MEEEVDNGKEFGNLLLKFVQAICYRIKLGEETIAVAIGIGCHLIEYITMWVTHHHCAQEAWDLADVYRL